MFRLFSQYLLRSLVISQPYRGRTIRTLFRNKLPGGQFVLNALHRVSIWRLERKWRHAVVGGRPEGRRFIAAIPHPFCGIGHGFSEWNAAFEWAQRLGVEFAHIPMKEDWDQFFGINDSVLTYAEVLATCDPVVVRVPYVAWSRGREPFAAVEKFVASVHSDRNLLFVLADAQNLYDHLEYSSQLREQFYLYGAWQHLPLHRQEGKLNIAVHIRRGDVAAMAEAQTSNWDERYVSEDWFIQAIDAVREVVAHKALCFHIYSQGTPEDLASICNQSDVILHLDSDEKETLLNMSKADVLIMSPSGFSYLAGILSTGLRVAKYPWWHLIPNRPDWVRVEGNDFSNMRNSALKDL